MYTFEEILGNRQIIRNIKTAVSSGKISHAYIINGAEGSGKRLLARTMAKALECLGDSTPCGICDSCRVFESDNHPDVIYVQPKKTKSLGVDDIREQVIEPSAIKQYHYQYKIFLIENADTMTVQAQNSLLKTLEEPPAYAVFILTATNLDHFLSTVLSRCVIFKMRGLSVEEISNYLKLKKDIIPEQAQVFAEYAQGSIGNALKIAQSEEFGAMRNAVIERLMKICQDDLIAVMAMAKELEEFKDNKELLDIAYLWYRDLLAAKKCGIDSIIQKDKKVEIVSQLQIESFESLFHKIDSVWTAKRQLSQNSNFQLTMEVMLIKLKESY